jgi:hypothetical protein
MDCGLILEKPRGSSAKRLKLDFPGIVFLKKTRGPSPRVRALRRPGPSWISPPWTGDHCRSRELTGARPPAAPVPESSDRGAGERKGGPVNSMAGLPRLGRRWKGVSPAAELQLRRATVRARRGLRERGVGGVGGFTGGGVGFYRAEARPSVFNGRR